VAKAHQERNLFTGYLGSRSLKMTRERRLVLDEIFALDGHFGADDLYLRLVRKKVAVSRATVYRTLEHLVGSGLVQKVYVSDVAQRKALYERAHGRRHHEHMHCVACGRIIEFSDDPLEDRQAEVCRKLGFKPLRHSLRIEGICADCQKQP
jgi:Fur family ferric uptake transcriptional regulator